MSLNTTGSWSGEVLTALAVKEVLRGSVGRDIPEERGIGRCDGRGRNERGDPRMAVRGRSSIVVGLDFGKCRERCSIRKNQSFRERQYIS